MRVWAILPLSPLCFNTQPPEGGWKIVATCEAEAEVSTHSHPKVAGSVVKDVESGQYVSTHSHPKVAGTTQAGDLLGIKFQHTATRRWLAAGISSISSNEPIVSTHSHPKVAGRNEMQIDKEFTGFNTQPPEGGWAGTDDTPQSVGGFNTQPPEGGWLQRGLTEQQVPRVSTHSHPKVAGNLANTLQYHRICFNTQPPEGGWPMIYLRKRNKLCFNTQPPEGGWSRGQTASSSSFGFNTQPPEGGWPACFAAR